jgi:hypothetical protein
VSGQSDLYTDCQITRPLLSAHSIPTVFLPAGVSSNESFLVIDKKEKKKDIERWNINKDVCGFTVITVYYSQVDSRPAMGPITWTRDVSYASLVYIHVLYSILQSW